MLKVSIPAEAGTGAVKDGTLPKIMQSALDTLKPEAAYFTTDSGKRTAFFFFDMKEPADLPAIAEPFFSIGAEVTATPAMTAADLRAGLQKVQGAK
jgi:hypothetical protein